MATSVHLPPIVSSECGPSACKTTFDCTGNQSNASTNRLCGLADSFDTNRLISQESFRLALTNPRIRPKGEQTKARRPLHLTALASHPRFLHGEASTERFYAGKSPYDLPHNNLDKFFMSGYEGFIPKSRYLCGRSFPHTAYDAMLNFEEQNQYLAHMRTQPVTAMEPKKVLRKGYIVYREDSGLIPNYCGHVPGNQSRYGGTFMNVTYDVLGKIKAGE